jgi:predicted metal-dependent hydrolase
VRNHEKEFWSLAGQVLAECDPQRRWLGANGPFLPRRPTVLDQLS